METTRVPAYCEECKEFLLLQYPAGIGTCPKCEGKPILYSESWDSTLRPPQDNVYDYRISGTHIRLLRKGNFCPKCGNKTLKFADTGFWD